MSNLEFKGKVVHVGEAEQVTDSFKKRILVVSDEHPDYPQTVPFEFTQNNVDKLDSVAIGDNVIVSFNLRGREWQGKYFANIQGWKLEVLNADAVTTPLPSAPVIQTNVEKDDGMPF